MKVLPVVSEEHFRFPTKATFILGALGSSRLLAKASKFNHFSIVESGLDVQFFFLCPCFQAFFADLRCGTTSRNQRGACSSSGYQMYSSFISLVNKAQVIPFVRSCLGLGWFLIGHNRRSGRGRLSISWYKPDRTRSHTHTSKCSQSEVFAFLVLFLMLFISIIILLLFFIYYVSDCMFLY